MIGEGAERFQFSLQHGGVKGGKRDLIVGEAGLGLTDEVDFPTGELTDEDFISSAEKLKVDDIFQNVPCVAAGVIHQQAAEGGVDEVVLGIRLQDIFPAHVEAVSLVEEKAVRQAGEVALYGFVVRFPSHAGQCVCDFARGNQTANVGGHVFHDALEDGGIRGAQACQRVLDEDGIVNARQVLADVLLFATEREREGKGAVFRVGFVGRLEGRRCGKAGEKFSEGKGEHLHFYIAPCQKCSEVAGEEIGI